MAGLHNRVIVFQYCQPNYIDYKFRDIFKNKADLDFGTIFDCKAVQTNAEVNLDMGG